MPLDRHMQQMNRFTDEENIRYTMYGRMNMSPAKEKSRHTVERERHFEKYVYRHM